MTKRKIIIIETCSLVKHGWLYAGFKGDKITLPLRISEKHFFQAKGSLVFNLSVETNNAFIEMFHFIRRKICKHLFHVLLMTFHRGKCLLKRMVKDTR